MRRGESCYCVLAPKQLVREEGRRQRGATPSAAIGADVRAGRVASPLVTAPQALKRTILPPASVNRQELADRRGAILMALRRVGRHVAFGDTPAGPRQRAGRHLLRVPDPERPACLSAETRRTTIKPFQRWNNSVGNGIEAGAKNE
jgi:hypothetical protein